MQSHFDEDGLANKMPRTPAYVLFTLVNALPNNKYVTDLKRLKRKMKEIVPSPVDRHNMDQLHSLLAGVNVINPENARYGEYDFTVPYKIVRYVLNLDNTLTFGRDGQPARLASPLKFPTIFGHRSVSKNPDACITAGNFIFNENNELMGFSNKSGDFKPSFESAQFALLAARKQGIAFAENIFVEVQHTFGGTQRLHVISRQDLNANLDQLIYPESFFAKAVATPAAAIGEFNSPTTSPAKKRNFADISPTSAFAASAAAADKGAASANYATMPSPYSIPYAMASAAAAGDMTLPSGKLSLLASPPKTRPFTSLLSNHRANLLNAFNNAQPDSFSLTSAHPASQSAAAAAPASQPPKRARRVLADSFAPSPIRSSTNPLGPTTFGRFSALFAASSASTTPTTSPSKKSVEDSLTTAVNTAPAEQTEGTMLLASAPSTPSKK